MIEPKDLRPGNYIRVSLRLHGEDFSYSAIKLAVVDPDFVHVGIDYPECECIEDDTWEYDLVDPVPLNEAWKKLLNVNFKYPSWINSVHELQNWYYWNNGKRELDTSKIPMSDGDNISNSHLEELMKED